jgi:hypothetical protein
MPEVPVTPEVAALLANILRGTRRSLIDWQVDISGHLSASLEADYAVTLQEVPDLEGQTPEPDHVLTLLVRGQPLFSLNRTLISAGELSKALGEKLEHSYEFFSELWRRAFLQANKISEHVDALNKALTEKIRDDDEPF